MFSICPFVRLKTYECDFLKTSEPNLMPVGTGGVCGAGMQQSPFGVRKSKIKVTRGRNRSQKSI